MAVEIERGLARNPLTLSWLNEPPPVAVPGLQFLMKGTEFEGMTMKQLSEPNVWKRFIERMVPE